MEIQGRNKETFASVGCSLECRKENSMRYGYCSRGKIHRVRRPAMCIFFVVSPTLLVTRRSLDVVMTQVRPLVTVCVRLRQSALPEAKQLSVFFPNY